MPSTTQAEEKPRYTARYVRDAKVVGAVSAATKIPWLTPLGVALSVGGLMLMIAVLVLSKESDWPFVAFCFLVSVSGILLINDGLSLHDRMLRRGGLYADPSATKDELRCEVNVYDNRIEVFGPKDAEKIYDYNKATKLFATDEVIALRYPGNEYVVIPRSAMSNSRYLNLIDFLDEKTTK